MGNNIIAVLGGFQELNISEKKELKGTIKEWKHKALERLGHARLNKQEFPESETLFTSFLQDQQMIKDYSDVLSYLLIAIDRPTASLYVLRDSDNVIQGMCSATLKVDHVFLHAVASAPWNIRMSTPSDRSSYKGAGTQLIQSILVTAAEEGVSELRTSPLTSSLGFYESVGLRERSDHWFIPIEEK